MKKNLLFILALAVSALSYGQMAISGELFAANPARFNGKTVTIKNIEIVKSNGLQGPSIGGPAGTLTQGAPGPIGSPTQPATSPCRPPRGYSVINISFLGAPEFKGCFFMLDAMKNQIERECGQEKTPAQITFRGDSRTGHHVTFYRLGY
jgi:hypothetical protein